MRHAIRSRTLPALALLQLDPGYRRVLALPRMRARMEAMVMADPFARPVPQVDAQIESLRGLNADAAGMLASVRRDQARLANYELQLMTAVDSRQNRIDLLLDERLQAMASEAVKLAERMVDA